jgi:hypothetical protein
MKGRGGGTGSVENVGQELNVNETEELQGPAPVVEY